MKRYTYRDKNTGHIITSDEKLKDRNLVLVSALKDGKMKSSRIMQR